jgi:hypothetical protein
MAAKGPVVGQFATAAGERLTTGSTEHAEIGDL